MKPSKVMALKGWESLDLSGDRSREQNAEIANEIASMYYQTFSTDAGQRVLEMMVQTFLTRPAARPGDDVLAVGIREGRADVVRQILQEMERAEG